MSLTRLINAIALSVSASSSVGLTCGLSLYSWMEQLRTSPVSLCTKWSWFLIILAVCWMIPPHLYLFGSWSFAVRDLCIMPLRYSSSLLSDMTGSSSLIIGRLKSSARSVVSLFATVCLYPDCNSLLRNGLSSGHWLFT